MRYHDDAAFGQLGAELITGTSEVTPPTNKVAVAISMLEDTVFTTLTPEDDSLFFGTATGALGDSAASETFPKGITVYGRFSSIQLASGAVIAYYAD